MPISVGALAERTEVGVSFDPTQMITSGEFREKFELEINQWCKEHEIIAYPTRSWVKHNNGDGSRAAAWFWSVPNERDRLMFMLKWSNNAR